MSREVARFVRVTDRNVKRIAKRRAESGNGAGYLFKFMELREATPTTGKWRHIKVAGGQQMDAESDDGVEP